MISEKGHGRSDSPEDDQAVMNSRLPPRRFETVQMPSHADGRHEPPSRGAIRDKHA